MLFESLFSAQVRCDTWGMTPAAAAALWGAACGPAVHGLWLPCTLPFLSVIPMDTVEAPMWDAAPLVLPVTQR